MPLCGVPSWLVAHKHRILFCICEEMGQERERKSSQGLTGQAGEGPGPKTKPYLSQSMPPLSLSKESYYFRKACDRWVLCEDDQVTVSFPDDNQPGLLFLGVTISDLSLFWGVKLASEPFT